MIDRPAPKPVPAWGSSLGLLGFTGSSDGQSLADRRRIVERVHRYGWAFDERQVVELEDCFIVDAQWSGDIMGVEPIDTVLGRRAIVKWLSGFWSRQDDQRRHHMMSVLVCDQTAVTARATSSLLMSACRASSLDVALTSFYTFDLAKEDGVWRIRHLFEGCDRTF